MCESTDLPGLARTRPGSPRALLQREPPSLLGQTKTESIPAMQLCSEAAKPSAQPACWDPNHETQPFCCESAASWPRSDVHGYIAHARAGPLCYVKAAQRCFYHNTRESWRRFPTGQHLLRFFAACAGLKVAVQRFLGFHLRSFAVCLFCARVSEAARCAHAYRYTCVPTPMEIIPGG